MDTTKSPVYPPKEWSGHIRSLTHYADIGNKVFPITPEKDFVWYRHRKREIKKTELGDTYVDFPDATIFFEIKEFDKPEAQPILSDREKALIYAGIDPATSPYTEAHENELIEIWRKETQSLPVSVEGKGELRDRQVIAAYCHIRKIDNSIPDDILDFMKDAALCHTDMYLALEVVSPLLDGLINRTPTGRKRDELCDMNIKVKSALIKANPSLKH